MLQLKMLTKVSDDRRTISVKDSTGVYNSTSNTGGWGGINFPLATSNRLLFRYQPVGSITSLWLDVTGLARGIAYFSGTEIALTPADFGNVVVNAQFASGEYILEAYTIFDYVTPDTPADIVTVDTEDGATEILLSGTSVVDDLRDALQPRAGIYRPDLPLDPINLINMSQIYTATTAFLVTPFDSDSTSVLSPVISVSAVIAINDEIDECVMKAIAGVAQIEDCGEEEDRVTFMTVLKFGMDINQLCGNHQGALNIRKALLSMCDCKCDC